MRKAYSKCFLGIINSLVNRFSNFLWHFIRLLGHKKDYGHIFLVVFQESEILKNAVSEDGVQTIDVRHI